MWWYQHSGYSGSPGLRFRYAIATPTIISRKPPTIINAPRVRISVKAASAMPAPVTTPQRTPADELTGCLTKFLQAMLSLFPGETE